MGQSESTQQKDQHPLTDYRHFEHVKACREIVESWGGEILQNHRELLEVCDVVEAEGASTYVEIGVYEGGTLLTLGGLCPAGAVLVGVDKSRQAPIGKVRQRLEESGYQVQLFFEDSVRAAPLVSKEVPDGIGLLLIDGDHEAGGCYRDWKAYFRLVRPGGLILIHDVANKFCPGLRRDVQKIQEQHEFSHVEKIAHESEFLCKIRKGQRPLGFLALRKMEDDPFVPY